MTAFFAPVGLALYALPGRTPLFYLCWWLTVAGGTAWFGPLFAAVQELAPAAHRATTVALAIVALNVAGVGAGPLVTGILGDRYGLTIGLATSVAVAALAIVPVAFAARRAPAPPAASH
jgi:predicted MFS family arabinose efflux permease